MYKLCTTVPDVKCLYIYVETICFSNVILILRVQFEKQDHETLFKLQLQESVNNLLMVKHRKVCNTQLIFQVWQSGKREVYVRKTDIYSVIQVLNKIMHWV